MLFFRSGPNSPRRRNKEKAILFTILIIYALYFLFFAKKSGPRNIAASTHDEVHHGGPHRDYRSGQATPSRQASIQQPIPREMVVASMKTDDVSWLYQYFPDWHKSVYVVDDKKAPLTVKLNKGRESMVYLT